MERQNFAEPNGWHQWVSCPTIFSSSLSLSLALATAHVRCSSWRKHIDCDRSCHWQTCAHEGRQTLQSMHGFQDMVSLREGEEQKRKDWGKNFVVVDCAGSSGRFDGSNFDSFCWESRRGMAKEELPSGRGAAGKCYLDTVAYHGSLLSWQTCAFTDGKHEDIYQFICRALSMLVLQGRCVYMLASLLFFSTYFGHNRRISKSL